VLLIVSGPVSTQDSAPCTENIICCSRMVPCVLLGFYSRRSRCRIPGAASLHCPGLPHVSPTLPLLSAHCPTAARPRALSLSSLYASSLNWCVLSASPYCEVAQPLSIIFASPWFPSCSLRAHQCVH
jgi:hypothetical protein